MAAELSRGGGQCATCGTPIDRRATYCRSCAKVPQSDPEAIAAIELLADQYRALQAQLQGSRERLHAAIREAKDSGHSFSQLRDASGLAVATIQSIVEG